MEDERAADCEVRRHRRDHEMVLARREDRAAGTERIAGTARRSRNDHAVAAVNGDPGLVDFELNVDGTARRAAAEDDVVEAVERAAGRVARDDSAGHHQTLLDPPLTRDEPFELPKDLVRADAGEETEPPHIHAEDGRSVGHGESCRA